MKQNKKIDLHLVLKYGRPLICFVLVVSFIFIYSFNVFADGINETWMSKYGSEGVMPRFNMSTAISNWGGDIQSLPRTGTGIQYFPYLLRTDYNIGSGTAFYSILSNYNTYCSALNYDTITYNNTTYDFTNAKKILTGAQDNSAVLRVYYFWVDDFSYDDFVICNGYVLSEQPFKVASARFFSNGGVQSSFLTPTSISSTRNGYYIYELNGANSFSSALFYAEMPIYISSSDESTGFKQFYNSSSYEASNDFSYNNLNSYHNFNYLYVEPEPEPEPEPSFQGQFYNYAGVNGYFQGLNNNGVLWITNFSFNEYMRLHPEEYKVKIHYTGNIDKADTNINVPVTYDYSEYIPLTYVVGNGSSYRLTREVLFTNFTSVSDPTLTLADGFESITTQATGISSQNYTTFNFWTFEGTQYSNNPSFGLNRSLTNIVRQVYINAEVSLIWDPENDGQDETISGVYRKRIGLLDGSEQVMENTISNNYNPPETSDPQYPGTLTDSQGNIVVGSGGTNIIVNPTNYSNFNAIIEYLYHIDADEFLALAGNNQNAIQYALNTLSSSESNGFFPVLKRTFDIIPDQIWDWIKVSLAVILGGAILGISYRMVRWR